MIHNNLCAMNHNDLYAPLWKTDEIKKPHLPKAYHQWTKMDNDEWIWHRVGSLLLFYIYDQDEVDDDGDYEQYCHIYFRTMKKKMLEVCIFLSDPDVDECIILHHFVNEINNTYAGFLNILFNQEINPAFELK